MCKVLIVFCVERPSEETIPRNNFYSMLHKLFITHCMNGTLIMNSFTFMKNSYNYETLAEAKNLEKVEIQLAKVTTARIFNLRCLAKKVAPKTLQMKWKGKKSEQPEKRKLNVHSSTIELGVPISILTTSKLK